jgi:predicted lipoprotein with Yx(FWY)xxD motif
MIRTKGPLWLALSLAALFLLVPLAQAQGNPMVQVANNPTLGEILTDSKGMTLYMFTKDSPGTSACTGGCLQAWPPLTAATGETPALASGVSGKLTTFQRADGATQVEFNDMPLYYFAQDKAPGDVKGQGVGGFWFVINPTSGPVKTAAAGATAEPGATAVGGATAATGSSAAAGATAEPDAGAPIRGATPPAVNPLVTASAPITMGTTSTATQVPPGTLPTTGGDNTTGWLAPLLGALVLFALAGFGLATARRTR